MVSERREAIEVARHLLRRKRGESDAVELEALDIATAAVASSRVVDWRDITEFRVLRDPDALYEEFLLRKEAGDAKQIGALLYAAMKFPEHPQAVEMLNCCAVHRMVSSERTGHLAQALQGYNMALSMAKGEERWKVALNRLALLNSLGIPNLVVREGGWLLTELPSDHAYMGMLCHNMALAYEQLGKFDMAARCLERTVVAVEYRPGDHERARISWAGVLVRAGRVTEAEDVLAQVVDTTSIARLLVDAQLQLAKKELQACIETATAAAQRLSGYNSGTLDRQVVSYCHRVLADAYTELGQIDVAKSHLAISRLFTGHMS